MNPETDSVIVRPFRKSDLPTVLDIAVAAWQPIFESFQALLGESIFQTAIPDWKTMKRGQIASACEPENSAHVLVAELDRSAVGFATYYLDQQKRVGMIGNNAVHPDYQGAGIGSQMYAVVLERMREAGMKCAKVTTGLDESHAPARRAYEKAGFSRALPSVDYYRTL